MSGCTVYLFGDQAALNKDDLRTLLLLNHDQVLNEFLDQAALLLRQEIQGLPWKQREQFPAFANLYDLLQIHADKPLHPALHLALSTIHHLALYVLQHGSMSQRSAQSDTSYIAGFGSGLLTAITTSCFPDRQELLSAGQYMVLLGFRIGLCASRARDETGNYLQSTKPWRMCVECDDATHMEELLTKFAQDKNLLPWSKPYIGGVSKMTVFVNGPPELLAEFVDTNNLVATECAVYAPFHAAEIFTQKDVEQILSQTPSDLLGVVCKHKLLLPHPETADLETLTLENLLRITVTSMLRQPVLGKTVFGSVYHTVKNVYSSDCTVVAIGTDNDTGIATALQPSKFVSTSDIVEGLPPSGKTWQPKIAITGFSGRFPKAPSLEAFWDVLHEGVDTHSEVPDNRWSIKTHVDPTGKRKNTSATRFGCWLDEPGLFDRSFFSISPREAPQMDPAQRLALMCAYEALEMSGIVPDATPSTAKSRVGVFIGVTSNDWCETNSAQDVDFYFIPGGNRAFIPGRINYFFKFSGPSFAVDTACSSSLAALHMATNALYRGEIDTAIVGGTNILTNPDVFAGLDRGHFLSRTGNCKSFDDDADGYCRGEGVGILILKRLEDAQLERDKVYACILSAATNHSAEAESITRPHVGAQQALFSQILAMGGIKPNDVDYVEMHGTGTQAGDSREMLSVSQTFEPWAIGDPRVRDTDLYVGSVKSNVGHGESVSGVTALIKVLLMMEKNEIVPHCGIKDNINHNFPPDLEQRRIKIARKPVQWLRSARPRRVLVNNFSAAGGNSCILLEDAPEAVQRTALEHYDDRPAHVVTVSAKTKSALEANLRSMVQFLQTCHSVSLPDISYTATARRVHYNYRASFVAPTIREMRSVISRELANPSKQFRGPPKMILAFAGQGSNYAGMARHLYSWNSAFKLNLNRLDAIVQKIGFPSVIPYLDSQSSEDEAEITLPMTRQLAHVCFQIALARLWKSWGVLATAVVGHSLGEYAALNYAGVLSDFDTLWLCGSRAKLLAEHCDTGTHSMLAARASLEEVTSHLAGVLVEVACINSTQETVVSGTRANIDEASRKLNAVNIRSSPVQLPYAFHSSQIQPILSQFSELVQKVDMKTPNVPVLSPLLSKVLEMNVPIQQDYLVRQGREAVNVLGAVQAGCDAGILDDRAHLLELGPNLILSRLIKRALGSASPAAVIPSLSPTQESSAVLASSVATAYRVGCNLNWAQYHQDYEHSVIRLPSYSWDLKDYWKQYVHDWSLRKGDPLPVSSSPQLDLSSTSCQTVTSAELKGDVFRLVVQSDVQSQALKPIVSGHTVNGITVCIGSVYADMAAVCGEAIREHFQADAASTAVLVEHVDMQESLIIKESSDPQMIQVEASCIWKEATAKITISSEGRVNATATVRFADREKERALLKKTLRNTTFSISTVQGAAADGDAERFTTSMAYRMVASLAHYEPTHRGVKEVTLNSGSLEATSVVATKAQHRLPGTFALHPCVFDNILQLATFVMNANENSVFDQEVYVVRGWDTAYLDEVLTDAKEYTTYVQMTARDKDQAFGDIAIMNAGSAVGCIKGVRVQRVPRRLMDVMFRSKAQPLLDPVIQNEAPAAAVISAPVKSTDNVEKALRIVSEESGHALEDMKDDDQIADIGIDSLLILVIVSRFREELDVDLQPAFLMEMSTIGALKSFLNGQDEPETSESDTGSSLTTAQMSASSDTSASDFGSDEEMPLPKSKETAVKEPVVKTTSAVLQGSLNKGPVKTVFLFPDGSGSATSYVNLPEVDKKIAIVGINCPYMKNPHEMKGSFEEITAILLAEVRRRQPKGPYHLGGWSAGGAFAFCATHLLQAAGEEVESLLLIDAPCPIGLGKLPQIFFDFWKTIHEPGGPVGDRPIPHWLMDHFQAVNNNLRGYTAQPLPPGRSPKTYIAWAARGTDNLAGFKHRHLLTPEESEDLGFLMDDKIDFGPRGWENLLDSELVIETAMTSNHFTIVRGDGAKTIAGMMRRACFS